MGIENTTKQNRIKITFKVVIIFVLSTIFSFSLVACDVVDQKLVATDSASVIQGNNVNLASAKVSNTTLYTSNSEKLAFRNAQQSRGYLTPEQVIARLENPVNDFTNTLSYKERERLNLKLRELYYDEGLMQVGVVIVATTDGMSLFDYGMQVANGWSLGTAEENNGLLIIMAVDDKEIYILTGLGIEDKITDEKVAQIIDEVILPSFKQSQFAQGLSQGIDALVDIMRN